MRTERTDVCTYTLTAHSPLLNMQQQDFKKKQQRGLKYSWLNTSTKTKRRISKTLAPVSLIPMVQWTEQTKREKDPVTVHGR